MSEKNGVVEIAFIGGSGLYEIDGLEIIQEKEIDTPFGKPSDKIVIGTIEGVKCAFLPRHGKGHLFLPSEINQRANMYALKSIGVKQIVAFTACGSLKEELKPKDFVIPDQIFDRTKNRINTFFGDGIVAHIGMASPFCQNLRKIIKNAVEKLEIKHHFGGTYVCIDGPQFSTKAESEVNRQHGFSIVGMTAVPEAKLAREAEMCYANISLVTDFDVWKEGEEVTNDAVVATVTSNIANSRRVIKELALELSQINSKCACQDALKTAVMTAPDKVTSSSKYKKIALLLDKYYSK